MDPSCPHMEYSTAKHTNGTMPSEEQEKNEIHLYVLLIPLVESKYMYMKQNFQYNANHYVMSHTNTKMSGLPINS